VSNRMILVFVPITHWNYGCSWRLLDTTLDRLDEPHHEWDQKDDRQNEEQKVEPAIPHSSP
jgi:hypothetical protein